MQSAEFSPTSLSRAFFRKIGLNVGKFFASHGLRDRWLILALLIGLGSGAQGFTWGRYDCLNLDRMAFRGIMPKGGPPYKPSDYLKPPFYTYLSHFLAKVPSDRITGAFFFWMEPNERFGLNRRMRVSLARTLNLAMFALCTTAIFIVGRRYFSNLAGRTACLLFASSAGWVPYQVFLTTDLAVVFMMLSSFVFAMRITNNPSMANSVMAGLLSGLAAATKYNGVAIAIALPVAHLLAGRNKNVLLSAFKRKSAWVCGICVPLGFVLGNPYAVLDWERFKADFWYNYVTTPVYSGATTGHSYEAFLSSLLEIYGWPTCGLLMLAFPVGISFVLRHKKQKSWHLWIMAASVSVLYFYYIGSFPRMETRFALPISPFVLLLGAAGFTTMWSLRLMLPLVVAIVSYNTICCLWIGRLFIDDPRNYVSTFALQHLQRGGVVEWSRSLPRLQGLPEDLTIHTIQTGLKQKTVFAEMFRNDTEMAAIVAQKETNVARDWFSRSARQSRNPDYVMWCSIDVDGFTLPEYNALFNETSGYRVVYDARSLTLPAWVYPQKTEFLHQRTTIWEKLPRM